MMSLRHRLAALAVLALLGACATGPASVPAEAPPTPVTDDATAALLDAALAGDHRSAANRARDAWRHPQETLLFFGLRADMTVMEIWPGAGGWYTEVLAPVLAERGRYLAAQWDPASDSQFVQSGLKAFRDKLDSRPDVYGKVEVVALQHPTAMTPVQPGSVDMVLTFRNIHNWMPAGNADAAFAAMYRALKPGGVVVLEGYTPRQLEFGTGGPRDRANLYTRELLEEAFAAFDILHLEEHESILAEGTKHVGRSALIDLIARKRM